MIKIENLKPINNHPIDIDYNNVDQEGAIGLDTKGAVDSINNLGITLATGQLLWVSDSELEYLGVVVNKNNNWVVFTINSTRNDLY